MSEVTSPIAIMLKIHNEVAAASVQVRTARTAALIAAIAALI
jgi:hypothetical protein